MADPSIPVADGDIRYEDRGGCFVLVDPTLPQGRRDVATAWSESRDAWRWRLNGVPHDGTPHPVAASRDQALRAMLDAYAQDAAVALRLEGQRPRFSFGEPQIFRI